MSSHFFFAFSTHAWSSYVMVIVVAVEQIVTGCCEHTFATPPAAALSSPRLAAVQLTVMQLAIRSELVTEQPVPSRCICSRSRSCTSLEATGDQREHGLSPRPRRSCREERRRCVLSSILWAATAEASYCTAAKMICRNPPIFLETDRNFIHCYKWSGATETSNPSL